MAVKCRHSDVGSLCVRENMIFTLFICYSVLMIVTEGASVKVHPGGNTTLPCSIKNDTEINWIITNGNQTFVRILKLEYLYGGKFKPEPSIIHPSYAGRITALISPINTHSLLLMNISDTDLMLYCCMDFTLEQSHCTKLDYQGCGKTNNLNQDWIHNSVKGKMGQDDWTLVEVLYTPIP